MVQGSVDRLIEDWRSGHRKLDPYGEVRDVIDRVRATPAGDLRTGLMNSVVRKLGQPDVLADFLDMLRWSALYAEPECQDGVRRIQQARMHSIYGWCGNTLLVESGAVPTLNTQPAPLGLAEKLQVAPAMWNLTLHVWQPNRRARGFAVDASARRHSISEPPHSHPFDFASCVVVGRLRQSIYRQSMGDRQPSGRYAATTLVQVNGIWPPHEVHQSATLDTLEDTVVLEAGDSYFMPSNMIHDVAFDPEVASTAPTLTLFLSAEFTAMPYAFLTPSMADFHKRNPNLRAAAFPINADAWHEKLSMLSRYIRGETKGMCLHDVVQYEGEYAFFHI